MDGWSFYVVDALVEPDSGLGNESDDLPATLLERSISPGCEEEAEELMAADLVSWGAVGVDKEETSRKNLQEDGWLERCRKMEWVVWTVAVSGSRAKPHARLGG